VWRTVSGREFTRAADVKEVGLQIEAPAAVVVHENDLPQVSLAVCPKRSRTMGLLAPVYPNVRHEQEHTEPQKARSK
jgi:hypothetical protein